MDQGKTRKHLYSYRRRLQELQIPLRRMVQVIDKLKFTSKD